jgi:hypothetical protein
MFWKKRRNINGNWQGKGVAILLPWLFLSLLAATPAGAAEKVKEWQDRFDHEPHAENKVKLLEKLGELEFDAATKAGQGGDYEAVGLIFEKFRDNARTAFELLKKQVPDADHHSNGYRRLELQVRRGIREVEETLVVVPDVVRPPLQLVRTDLISLDDQLIALLFPQRVNPQAKPSSPPVSKP